MAVFHDEIRTLKSIYLLVGHDMTATFKLKKFLLVWITITIGITCAGAQAQTNPGITVPGYGIWDFSAVYGSFDTHSALLQLQPWWGSSSIAQTFASAGGNFGQAPDFAYSVINGNFNSYYYKDVPNYDSVGTNNSYGFATAICSSGCAAVPEIDGALIPQVGLLLAGLFIILGRRKENTDPMLAV